MAQNSSNSSCHFPKHKLVPLQALHHSLVLWHIIPMKISSWNITYFRQKEPIKVQFFRLLCTLKKFTQLLLPFLKLQGLGLFKSCFTAQCHERWFLCIFFSSNLKYFGQKQPIKVKFSDFWLVRWKLTKFLMSYLNHKSVFL